MEVVKVDLKTVQDASTLDAGIHNEPDQVIAVIGKTEGNGGLNDFTCNLADRTYRRALMKKNARRSLQGHPRLPIVKTIVGDSLPRFG